MLSPKSLIFLGKVMNLTENVNMYTDKCTDMYTDKGDFRIREFVPSFSAEVAVALSKEHLKALASQSKSPSKKGYDASALGAHS
jgi:hypothetical protein